MIEALLHGKFNPEACLSYATSVRTLPMKPILVGIDKSCKKVTATLILIIKFIKSRFPKMLTRKHMRYKDNLLDTKI